MIEGFAEVAHDVDIVDQDSCLRRMSVALRNGFHMSIRIRLMQRLFFSARQANNWPMLAAERSTPPN